MTFKTDVAVSLAGMRKDYRKDGLDEAELDPDPFRQFLAWFDEAREATKREPNAMAVATASNDAVPAVRMVLLKSFDARGFVFYTNYESGKGHDLRENPRAALLFYWPELERQVRIAGTVERVSREESETYFHSRPRASQEAAAISRQSAVLPSRAALEAAFAGYEAEHRDEEIPLPDFWGGYRVAPASFEFWQGRQNRMHDRLRYTRQAEGGWRIERLSP